MKNYLIAGVRPVSNIWGYWNGSGANPNMAQDLALYQEMYQISRASAREFLEGDWIEVQHRAPVLDARLFQIAQWYTVKELWFSEPCNLLLMGADTMFLQPTEIFGRYDQMMMFNYTDPKHHAEFPHYFNDDVRYIPASMDPAVWDVGEQRMKDWFTHRESNWACGQLIHNAMLWSQGITVEQALDPKMAWQAFNLDTEASAEWNNCELEDAHILHLHGSRNADSRLEMMRSIAEQLGIAI